MRDDDIPESVCLAERSSRLVPNSKTWRSQLHPCRVPDMLCVGSMPSTRTLSGLYVEACMVRPARVGPVQVLSVWGLSHDRLSAW